MPFPKADFCVVCDGLRPELGGKATILGFYGVAPNVELLIPVLDAPAILCFVFGLPSPEDRSLREYQHFLTIIDPSGKILLQTPPTSASSNSVSRVVIAYQVAISPTQAGRHAIKVMIGGEISADTSMMVRVATPSELKDSGLPL